MSIRHLLSGVATLSTLLVPLAAANAQGASPGANQGLGGPAIPGVCMLSQEAVLANAAVGKAAFARLKQITDAAQTEIDGERAPIDADAKVLQAQAAKLSPTERSTREQALATRVQALQVKAQQRSREVEATRAKALQRLATEIQPVIARVYSEKACGLLVNRNTVLGGNMTNDLTAAVVKALDAKITTITFNREVLPSQAAAARSN